LTVAALAVLTPFVLVGLLLLNADRIVGAAVARIPLAWEEQLGELVVAQSIAEAGQWPEGEATAILDDLTRRLLAHVDSPYAFRSYLIDNAQANAFAVPGGVVVVWTGLLRETERPEELAGVLAHEMQHVVQRHTMRALVHGLGLRVALEILLGGRGTLGDLAAQMVQQFGALQFSRDQETQADLAAVEVLQAAGIDPTGLVTFFERMGSRAGEPAAILSTHPPSAERAERIRDRLAASRSFAPLPYDWPAVRQEFEGAPGRGP
ncbi:MAG: M48 family metallopeptidase, partial [Candidatus Krumholzibacteriia bacterium]